MSAAAVPRWPLVLGVALVAANLRPAVTSVGPLLPQIRHDLSLSAPAASLLTTLPVLCFGILAPVGPRLAGRLGMERVVAGLLLAMVVGLAVRPHLSTATLFAGTVLVGAGIAVANVLLPALVKRDFPSHAGAVTGVYSTTLIVMAAAAAGLTVPVEHALGGGWRAGLSFWAVPVFVAIIGWLPRLAHPSPPRDEPEKVEPGSLLRDPIAWRVTAFMGLQSLGFYAIVSWLPSLFQQHGVSATSSGVLLSVSTVVGAPLALVVPPLAARARDQTAFVAASTALTALGLAGLLAAPTAAPYLWVVVLGLGQQTSFPLALTLIVVRSRDSAGAAQLSAMAQGWGYLFAAGGPLAVGAVHGVTTSWAPAVGLLLALTVPQLTFGLSAARRGHVGA